MPDNEPMSEADFIALAGAPKADDVSGREPGRPHEPAQAVEDPKPKAEEEPAKGSEAAGEGSDDKGEEKPKEGETPEPEGEEEAPELTDEQQAKFDEEFTKALEAEGANPSLENIPEEARPLVAKKLRDLEAGFTRATQRLAEERKGAIAFKAEERFRKEHPAHFIVAMLRENPKLSEDINKIIEETDGNATAVEGHKALVERERAKASTAEQAEIEKGREGEAHVERIVQMGRAAARAAGVPFDMGVEEGIAAHMLIHGDVDEATIRQIAQAKAAIYKRTQRQNRRDASGQYIKDKIKDRKTAGLQVKPGSGSAPAPGARRMAKNDQEFIEQMSARND